jgi:DNA-binding transcriptional ArsR family regulator
VVGIPSHPLDTYQYHYYSISMTNTKEKPLLRGIEPAQLCRAAETIKLLGHPERLKIVEVLEAGESTVSDIQAELDLPQAIVSQHLAKLRGLGIVAAKRDGIHVYYRVMEPKVRHILECIRKCDV